MYIRKQIQGIPAALPAEAKKAKYDALAGKKKLGVCLEASRDTAETVPYLTHQDFCKQLKQAVDMCDFVTVNLSSHDPLPAGLEQYYRNPAAIDKLLKEITKVRLEELGKVAAVEYEKAYGDLEDYTSSVRRLYQRQSVVSNLKPIKLLLRVDIGKEFGELEE